MSKSRRSCSQQLDLPFNITQGSCARPTDTSITYELSSSLRCASKQSQQRRVCRLFAIILSDSFSYSIFARLFYYRRWIDRRQLNELTSDCLVLTRSLSSGLAAKQTLIRMSSAFDCAWTFSCNRAIQYKAILAAHLSKLNSNRYRLKYTTYWRHCRMLIYRYTEVY